MYESRRLLEKLLALACTASVQFVLPLDATSSLCLVFDAARFRLLSIVLGARCAYSERPRNICDVVCGFVIDRALLVTRCPEMRCSSVLKICMKRKLQHRDASVCRASVCREVNISNLGQNSAARLWRCWRLGMAGTERSWDGSCRKTAGMTFRFKRRTRQFICRGPPSSCVTL